MGSCPHCGSEVSFAVEEARVLTGTCPSCQKVTTLFEGPVPLGSAGPEAAPGEAAEKGEDTGLECSECGGSLTIEPSPDGSIEVACTECETVARYVPEERGSPRGPSEEGPRSRPGRDRERASPGPRSRPCRQCGAPLTFTTDENGQLTGECASCGNRFTLPPRTDGYGGGNRGPPRRYGSRPGPRYGGRSGGWSSGGGYRPRSGDDRRRDRGSDDDRDDRSRRRRRRDE